MNMNYIHVFSRKEALETGELVDISSIALEAGVKFPTAVTRTVWEGIIQPDFMALNSGESVSGRTWDIAYIFSIYARNTSGSEMHFPIAYTVKGKTQISQLKAVIGPGDNPSPVITIMHVEED